MVRISQKSLLITQCSETINKIFFSLAMDGLDGNGLLNLKKLGHLFQVQPLCLGQIVRNY